MIVPHSRFSVVRSSFFIVSLAKTLGTGYDREPQRVANVQTREGPRVEELVKYASFAGSVLATASTAYFWLVRANGERPRLKTYRVAALDGAQLAGGPGTMRSQFYVKAVVANYSSLPNAVLGVRTWVKGRDGAWQEAATILDEKSQPPFNLPPLHTVPLGLTITITVPEAGPDAPRPASRREAAFQSVAQPVEIKVELRGLSEKRFSDVLSAKD
jgi:hypothetical protein